MGHPRIGITGCAGSGKTTLAGELARRRDLVLIPEAMRGMLETGFDLHALSREAHRALLRSQAERLAADLARVPEGLVSDRTPLDFVAFWLSNGYAVDDPAGTEALVTRAVMAMADYTLVVLLPWGPAVQDDGVRSPNPWHQLHFQTIVEGLCRRWVQSDRLLRLDAEAGEAHGGRVDRVLARLGSDG